MAFWKVDFIGTIALLNLRNKWTKVQRTFYIERRREHCSVPGFQILNMSIRFRDIRTQSGKRSEIAPYLACFLPQNFFGGKIPNFWNGIYKLNMLPNMWQNFVEIGPQTSEISHWKKIKKETAVILGTTIPGSLIIFWKHISESCKAMQIVSFASRSSNNCLDQYAKQCMWLQD